MEAIQKLKETALGVVSREYTFSKIDRMHLAYRCVACGEVCLTDAAMAKHCGRVQDVGYPIVPRLYPLPERQPIPEAPRALITLPVALVEWGLGLTSVGPRVRWTLAEACMRLGYFPPYDLVKDGLGDDPGLLPSRLNDWILAGASRTALIVGQRAGLTRAVLERERKALIARRKVR